MNLRLSFFGPFSLAFVLLFISLGFAASPQSYPADFAAEGFALGGALAALVAAVAAEFRLFRPLVRLASDARARAGEHGLSRASLSSALQDIRGAVQRLAARLDEAETRAARESEARRHIEEELLELRERYVVAVDRAADGAWEWDVKTGRTDFSPRWRAMLGYGDHGPRNHSEWEALVHPEERQAVAMRLQNHLDGLTPAFDAEYRLRGGTGEYRWLYSRGTALRHASRRPYRFVVMDHDIHQRKTLEEALVSAAEGLSGVSGEDFFRRLIQTLSEILGTRDNMVAHCIDDPPTRVRTLAYLSRGKFAEPFEFDLEGTSCGAVIARKQIVYCPTGVCDLWPAERKYDRDSYLGVPMFDSGGKIIGHFACMDGEAMRKDLPHLAIFKIFSVRAAAELERTLLKDRLGDLENRVSA